MLILALCALGSHASPTVADCSCHAYLPEGPQEARPMAEWPDNKPWKPDAKETHLKNIRQLTFGGQNAEAYWSLDGRQITYQTRQPGYPDEQIFTMDADGSRKALRSTGLGRCTCSYFSPDGKWLYFSSTHERNRGAQQAVDMSKGYVWRVNPDFALYRVSMTAPSGRAPEAVLKKNGYVAETTISPDGKFMVFTGDFENDIDIYRANLDGTKIKRLTNAVGYDGGPFISWDGKKIVYRRGPLTSQAETDEYKSLRDQHLVRPSRMDVWIMDADGRNKRQVTRLPGASFAPFLLPDGKRIIFSSNHHDPQGREFDLFVVNVDGTGLKQVTFTPDFDGFPMVSRDGKRLIWASNRHGSVPHETNIFVADWVD
ncbi:MAG: PD40 domain-containing protein [Fimbriimonadaceae bacterium]|nr:PD40 domain-containing protein [Fimbriimonadaceae bacterium]QYK56883.1 MAG: PD40 domain-containing protein [Fimbriimonadaceae bacterium]